MPSDLTDLVPQRVLQLGVDDRQRLVHQHGRHVIADKATAERDQLLVVGGEPPGGLPEPVVQVQRFGDLMARFSYTVIDW
ncbi:hypothetical protein [Streptomyces sp. NPDC002994]|uniref:hypothetical protein n=1 Tax=Streptomyces sp. NPDC002994 TaxID=3154441 RepID=UPI0033B23759